MRNACNIYGVTDKKHQIHTLTEWWQAEIFSREAEVFIVRWQQGD
jgi:hypothetical protein